MGIATANTATFSTTIHMRELWDQRHILPLQMVATSPRFHGGLTMKVKFILTRHPTSLKIETVSSEQSSWHVEVTGFDGALGQIVPRTIRVSAVEGAEPAIIRCDNTYALTPSTSIQVEGFQKTAISIGHSNLKRVLDIEGEDVALVWNDEGTAYDILLGDDKIARVAPVEGDQVSDIVSIIEADEQYASFAVSLAVAICLVS